MQTALRGPNADFLVRFVVVKPAVLQVRPWLPAQLTTDSASPAQLLGMGKVRRGLLWPGPWAEAGACASAAGSHQAAWQRRQRGRLL